MRKRWVGWLARKRGRLKRKVEVRVLSCRFPRPGQAARINQDPANAAVPHVGMLRLKGTLSYRSCGFPPPETFSSHEAFRNFCLGDTPCRSLAGCCYRARPCEGCHQDVQDPRRCEDSQFLGTIGLFYLGLHHHVVAAHGCSLAPKACLSGVHHEPCSRAALR